MKTFFCILLAATTAAIALDTEFDASLNIVYPCDHDYDCPYCKYSFIYDYDYVRGTCEDKICRWDYYYHCDSYEYER